MKNTIPRTTIKAILKKHQPNMRREADLDLLVHLNCLLFVRKLMEEAQVKALENKSSVIKPEHIKAVAKTVLKKSKG
ncbi:hypothetical protein GDO86_009445 [Hymenochirus boettgeri]|uniref:Centromere protein W n=1 Tax=Hymenochirus boettgeri TaxID=247094 RepID=A0A8T2JLR5_9PIPI|nr:hypothetical protein GDO86_009445 [Hymenochirus boettgeri]